MNLNESLLAEVSYLTLLSVEGTIRKEQFDRLESLLQTMPLARQYYLNIINVHLGLEDLETLLELHEEGTPLCCNSAVLKALADYEKTAPAVEIEPAGTEESESAKRIRPAKTVQKVNKLSVVMAVISMAALVFMIVYIEVVSRVSRKPVASIADSIHAEWGLGSEIYNSGDWLQGSYDAIELRKGILKIEFTDGAETILEGPSVFSCVSGEKLFLHSGKVYARVPMGSEGFSVCTLTTKIIDLGTEFGVSADQEGVTDLHVFKGMASLVTVPQNQRVTSLVLNAGQAYRTSRGGDVNEIPLQKANFVRGFDSSRNFVWRSDMIRLNLADVVGGGNGMGTGEIEKGISLTSGRCVSDFAWSDRIGTPQYLPVQELAFVDGIFVPDSENGMLQVSTKEHLFKECPNTNGLYFDEIRNGGPIRMTEGYTFPMTFDGQEYGTVENPALFMHANAGITFDLEAVRKAMPAFQITAFRARCVLFEKSDRIRTEKTDIFVLVDGHTRFKQRGFDQNYVALNVDFPLHGDDQFLTLITTDGDGSIAIDWVGFLEPVLILESR